MSSPKSLRTPYPEFDRSPGSVDELPALLACELIYTEHAKARLIERGLPELTTLPQDAELVSIEQGSECEPCFLFRVRLCPCRREVGMVITRRGTVVTAYWVGDKAETRQLIQPPLRTLPASAELIGIETGTNGERCFVFRGRIRERRCEIQVSQRRRGAVVASYWIGDK